MNLQLAASTPSLNTGALKKHFFSNDLLIIKTSNTLLEYLNGQALSYCNNVCPFTAQGLLP